MLVRCVLSEFEAALDELTVEGGALTRRALVMLSGPSPTECDAFISRWREVSTERKREIMAWMV